MTPTKRVSSRFPRFHDQSRGGIRIAAHRSQEAKRRSLTFNDLDKPPCRLTDRDYDGTNSPKTRERKLQRFEEWKRERAEFEDYWANWEGEMKL